MSRNKKDAPEALQRDEGDNRNTYERKESVNTSLSEWLSETKARLAKHGSPMHSVDDPRAVLLLANAGPNERSLAVDKLQWLIDQSPEQAGELYFQRYVEKPEPPLEMPAWATSRDVTWGSWPDVEIVHESDVFQAGELSIRFTNLVAIQCADDAREELLDAPVVHDDEAMVTIRDGRTSMNFIADADDLFRLAAAVDDAARYFARATQVKQLHRSTEPGAPSFEEVV